MVLASCEYRIKIRYSARDPRKRVPKPKADEPRDQQLLIRLTARQQEVLESVAHLEHTTPNRYAHQTLVDHLGRLMRNRRVRADLQNRAAYDSDAASTTRLNPDSAADAAISPIPGSS